jgi:hypothetical protein
VKGKNLISPKANSTLELRDSSVAVLPQNDIAKRFKHKALTSILGHFIIERKQPHLYKIKWICIKGGENGPHEKVTETTVLV